MVTIHMIKKATTFFLAGGVGLTSVSSTQLAPKATASSEVTQNHIHYAVKRHLRAPVSMPVQSPYATSYQ